MVGGGAGRGELLRPFVAVFVLAIVAFTFANHELSKNFGLSYAAWALAGGLLVSNTVGTPEWR